MILDSMHALLIHSFHHIIMPNLACRFWTANVSNFATFVSKTCMHISFFSNIVWLNFGCISCTSLQNLVFFLDPIFWVREWQSIHNISNARVIHEHSFVLKSIASMSTIKFILQYALLKARFKWEIQNRQINFKCWYIFRGYVR